MKCYLIGARRISNPTEGEEMIKEKGRAAVIRGIGADYSLIWLSAAPTHSKQKPFIIHDGEFVHNSERLKTPHG